MTPEERKRLQEALNGPALEILAGSTQSPTPSTSSRSLTAKDILEITSAISAAENTGVGRANAFRAMTGRGGTFSGGSVGSSVSTALTKLSGAQDTDMLAEIRNNQSQAGLKTLEEHRDWYTTEGYPAYYFDAARDSFRDYLTARQSEKSEQRKSAGEVRTSELHPGVMAKQKLQAEIDRLTKQEKEIAIAQGEIRTTDDGNFTITEDWVTSEARPGEIGVSGPGYWQFKSKAPRWASIAEDQIREVKDGDKFVIEIRKDGKWVKHSDADRWQPQAIPQGIILVDEYIKALQDAGEVVSPGKRAELLEQFALTAQSEVRPAYTAPMINKFDEKKEAFANSTGTIKRMLVQLSDPEVAVGTVRGLFVGIENIGSQFKQFAAQFQQEDFVDPMQYEFKTAEKSSQLALNITGLAYALARQKEGGRLAKEDVQLRIDMISGRTGKKPMSKRVMRATLMELFNTSVRDMGNSYLNALESKLPGTNLYATPQEFFDSRDVGHLEVRKEGEDEAPIIHNGRPVHTLGYQPSKGKFRVFQWWYVTPEVRQ